jgi:hypothetical protein
MLKSKKFTTTIIAAAVCYGLTSGACLAKVSAEESAKLGTTLTPMGSEKNANAAGTIPEWNGGITQAPAGYKPGDFHPDPYAADKVKFTITKANLDQYKDNLTPGQVALFEASQILLKWIFIRRIAVLHIRNTFMMKLKQTRCALS